MTQADNYKCSKLTFITLETTKHKRNMPSFIELAINLIALIKLTNTMQILFIQIKNRSLFTAGNGFHIRRIIAFYSVSSPMPSARQ